jgi:hypothetical protein
MIQLISAEILFDIKDQTSPDQETHRQLCLAWREPQHCMPRKKKKEKEKETKEEEKKNKQKKKKKKKKKKVNERPGPQHSTHGMSHTRSGQVRSGQVRSGQRYCRFDQISWGL